MVEKIENFERTMRLFCSYEVWQIKIHFQRCALGLMYLHYFITFLDLGSPVTYCHSHYCRVVGEGNFIEETRFIT